MIIRCFTRFYPNIPFKSSPSSLITPKGETWSFQGVEGSYVNHPRAFAEKSDKSEDPGEKEKKEEVSKVKMQGFVHPETINEKGFFSKKNKKQLEGLKRNPDRPQLTNPEKKDY